MHTCEMLENALESCANEGPGGSKYHDPADSRRSIWMSWKPCKD